MKIMRSQFSDEQRQSIIDDIPAYALGALDEDAVRLVEELVEEDADAAVELAEMLETIGEVSARVGVATPPDSLRANLMSKVRGEAGVSEQAMAYSALVSHIEKRIASDEVEDQAERVSIWERVSGMVTAGRLAFATSLASFAIVGIMALQLGADNVELNRKIADMQSEVNAANAYNQDMIDDMSSAQQLLTQAHDRISRQDEEIVRMSAVNDALRASMNDQLSLTYATLRNEYQSPDWQPDATMSQDGYAYLLEHQYQPVGALVIGGVEKAPPGEEYRLYLIGDADVPPDYVASFNMNEAGYGTILFELPSALSDYNGAHITRERITDPPDPSLAAPENRFKPQ